MKRRSFFTVLAGSLTAACAVPKPKVETPKAQPPIRRFGRVGVGSLSGIAYGIVSRKPVYKGDWLFTDDDRLYGSPSVHGTPSYGARWIGTALTGAKVGEPVPIQLADFGSGASSG